MRTAPRPARCFLVDLHAHTAGRSDDSTASAAELRRAAASAGIDGVCFTEHDAFWRPGDLRRAAAWGPLVTLAGAEINTDAGHVLVFGLEEYRFGFHHPDVLRRAVEEAGGVMVAAHPYRHALPPGAAPNTPAYDDALRRALDNPLYRIVEAVETVNGRADPVQSKFAAAVAKLAGLPATGGSDAHAAGDVGDAATMFERPVASLAALIRELRAGRVRPWKRGRARCCSDA